MSSSESHDTGAGQERPTWRSLVRGWKGRCPACGEGKIVFSYLKIADHCPACNQALHHQRADDAPPYFTILIVGHLVVPLVIAADRLFQPDLWAMLTTGAVLTVGLSLYLLPHIKGALVGLQWAKYMHGFGGSADVEPES